jgi:bifunctional UDP-N-acetylglucosamine pyrophosphorylase/glucosamine-1-phosphate N-acetyltransferase
MSALSVMVLAAGQGTRMKSATPKVLHPVCGKPLLEHVLSAVEGLKPRSIAVVVGVGRNQVMDVLGRRKSVEFVIQKEQRGSGHAVLMGRSWLKRQRGALLVVYGDTPLLTTGTLEALVKEHGRSRNAATFLAMDMADPTGYGRMILDAQGAVERIVEHKDATPEERAVRLANSGVACWDVKQLLKALPKLRPNNAKREYYLTDAAAFLRQAGGRVGVQRAADAGETQGINNRLELSQAESFFRRQILERWMRDGVTIVDPGTTYIDAEVELAPDTTIFPGTMILGKSRVASFCELGPYSVIDDAIVEEGAKVGPFARLRPGTVLGKGVRVGNFVEIKKSRIGVGSKVNHLTYLGDAELGRNVNIGAGTITCNYDGFKKSLTRIADGAFIGSNSNLVAPVQVGREAIIAAGSTITHNIPAGSLAVARPRELIKEKWAYEFRKKQKTNRPH